MGLFDMFRSAPADIPGGVYGSAQVVSVSIHHGDTVNQTCDMNLVISAPNVTPLAVEFRGPVKRDVWPSPGAMLPVLVDPQNPSNYRILWDQVTPAKEAARIRAESVAAMQRGETVDTTPLFGTGFLSNASVQVVGDVSSLTEEQKAKLRMFGLDPEALIAAATNGTSATATFATMGAPADDTISQLERLAALRDKGAITEAEFAAQKAKILG